MSLGVYGFGCEDSLNHLLNYVWPNVFETSPHVIQAVMGALEGLRVAIGPCRMLQYCLQVRPARTIPLTEGLAIETLFKAAEKLILRRAVLY